MKKIGKSVWRQAADAAKLHVLSGAKERLKTWLQLGIASKTSRALDDPWVLLEIRVHVQLYRIYLLYFPIIWRPSVYAQRLPVAQRPLIDHL